MDSVGGAHDRNVGPSRFFQLIEDRLGVLDLDREHRDVAVGPVDFAHIGGKVRPNEETAIGEANRQSLCPHGLQVIAARDEHDRCSGLVQKRADRSADGARSDDDRSLHGFWRRTYEVPPLRSHTCSSSFME